MADKFSDQVTDWVREAELRTKLAFRASIEELTDEAQKPVEEGGSMPVDTGFLRNSGQAAIDKLPEGPSQKPKGYVGQGWDQDAVAAVIMVAELDDTVFFGWTAEYAPYMEDAFGFMRLTMQRWPQIVDEVSKRLEKEGTGNVGQ